MANNAQIGYGYKITIGGTTIGEVLECKPGKQTQEHVKVQTADSSDLFGYKILGWKDVSDWEIKTVWYQSQYTTLVGLIGSFNTVVFTRPDNTNTITFQGAVTEVGNDVPLKEYMTNDFKLTVSGGLS